MYSFGISEHKQQLRFFAHLCLFLRHIGRDVPLEAASVILKAYINLLQVYLFGLVLLDRLSSIIPTSSKLVGTD